MTAESPYPRRVRMHGVAVRVPVAGRRTRSLSLFRPAQRWAAARLSPAWPLQLLLVAFPIWWALGLSNFIFQIFAVPMLVQLSKMRRLRLPPYAWLWGLHLGWTLLSLLTLGENPPGLAAGAPFARVLSIALSLSQDASVTITLLYVVNLPVALISQAAIGRWMGYFFLTVAGGGFVGLLVPSFSFVSPTELALPASLTSEPFVRSLVHPIAAQVQSVIGDSNARPSAPFGYTNDWGYAVSVLLLWFIAAWVLPARGKRRVIYAVIAASTLVPILLSLNRGVWIGLIIAALVFLLRQLIGGKVGLILAVTGAATVTLAVLAAVTPLVSVISARLDNGNSDSIRGYVLHQSVVAIEHSPFLGYGGTRHTEGSAASIAVGNTPQCPNCGQVATGSTGQLWSDLFNEGILGTVFYFGFFAASFWTNRGSRGALYEAALLTIVLAFVYMFFYTAYPVAPTLTVISIGLLARGRRSPATDPRVVRVPFHAG